MKNEKVKGVRAFGCQSLIQSLSASRFNERMNSETQRIWSRSGWRATTHSSLATILTDLRYVEENDGQSQDRSISVAAEWLVLRAKNLFESLLCRYMGFLGIQHENLLHSPPRLPPSPTPPA